MNLSRRSFFAGAAAILCVPAIVRASSLMPVRNHPLVQSLPCDFTVTEYVGENILVVDPFQSYSDYLRQPFLQMKEIKAAHVLSYSSIPNQWEDMFLKGKNS
jgi:hypothetical protein